MTANRISFAFLALLIGAFCQAEAQSITAASCNATDVQTAFNKVTSSTTTVNIPAGTCDWTTEATLTVPSANSALSILGAGSLTTTGGGDKTVLIDNYASNNALILITTGTSSSYFRFAGITIQGGTGSIKEGGALGIKGNSQNTRIDHNHFNLAAYATSGEIGVRFAGWIYGVFDHNLCDDTYGIDECVNVWDPTYGGYSNGDGAWNDTTGLGTNRFMFLENNTFNGGTYVDDCYAGGREVLRFNTINGAQAQTHPTGGGGRIRGCRAKEVYQNTFNGNSSCNSLSGFSNCIYNAYWLSSGTGVVWGNIFPIVNSSANSGYEWLITLQSMRAADATYKQSAPPAGWGYCGTQVDGTDSAWDQNTSNVSGYACLDQPGRGAGDLLTGGFTSDGSGSNNVCDVTSGQCKIPNYDGSWPNQALEPIYEWLDNITPVPNNPGGIINVIDSTDLIQNQDYYSYSSSFTGATGVGSGTLAARPTTCNIGVAYWATDQGTWNQTGSGGQGVLYKCGSSNNWVSFYTPYTYPHPLNTSTEKPSPPTLIRPTPTLQ
jgi:hypothetical protein